MSVFEIDQKGQKALAEEARLNPLDASQIAPTTFAGLEKGVGMGIMKGGARVGQFVGMAGAVVPMAVDAVTGSSLTDRYFESFDNIVSTAVDHWTPNAQEVGKAGQLLGGLSEIALPLMVSAGNPIPLIGSQQMGTATDLVRQGVDADAAAMAGLLQGGATAIGFRLPAAYGSTLTQRLATGAGVNLAVGLPQRSATSTLLENAGRPDLAKAYGNTPEAMTLDTLTGLVFGGLAHIQAPKIKPSDADAVLTANNAKHFQQDTAPGVPANAGASVAHQSALESAIEQLVRGERVSVPDSILAAEFVRPLSTDTHAANAIRDVLPPALRWSPSERLVQVDLDQRRALRYDAPELNEYAATVEHRYGLPGGLINALKNAGEKSNSTQVSPAGAAGVMQFMPENLKKYGVTDATDPVQIIDAAGRYLRDTMRQYGGNIEAVIADYNGGPRQARRVLNGEPPKAAETAAYLDRVRAYLERQGHSYTRETSAEAFAEKTGRRVAIDAENRPIFEDGTAFPREAISDFYDQHVAHLGKADTTPVPDVLFRIGEVDDFTAAGLREFLPGFADNLREARISAQSIRHIHNSRPGIAREVLQRLDEGALYADEVLPNPKDRTRALVVLKDAAPTSSKNPKHLSQVLEVSANGKGIDVVTAMSTRDSALNEARKLKQEITESKGGTDLGGGATYPSSSLADSLASQPHAAADFPTFAQGRGASIAQQHFSASDRFPVQGKTAATVTERGATIHTQFVAVEASSLLTSHDNALRKNPDFPPELQPRDRGRAASEAQIAKIENGINPELLAESPKASDGAPIIGTDSVVESGNARTIALRRAYESGKADTYRQWLIDNSERFGLDPAQVGAMKQPVLARVGLGKYDRVEFARQANESAVAQMSVTEVARADAARMPDLMGLVANEDGTINMAQSAPFIRAFLAKVVSPSEHGAMVTADGSLSQQGLQRIRNAVFAKAYGEPEIVAMMAESTDANVKNILAGMLRAAPAVARLRELIEAGARYQMDVSGNLVQAVRQFSQLRRDGVTVQQMLAQYGLFDGGPSPELRNLLIGLEENAKAPKRVAELIGRVVDAVDRLGDPRQGSMFGDMATPTTPEIITRVIESVRDDFEVKSTGDLFKTPEVEAARQVMDSNPDMRVVLDDGTEVSVREAMARMGDDARQAESDAKAFEAVVTCYLRNL